LVSIASELFDLDGAAVVQEREEMPFSSDQVDSFFCPHSLLRVAQGRRG